MPLEQVLPTGRVPLSICAVACPSDCYSHRSAAVPGRRPHVTFAGPHPWVGCLLLARSSAHHWSQYRTCHSGLAAIQNERLSSACCPVFTSLNGWSPVFNKLPFSFVADSSHAVATEVSTPDPKHLEKPIPHPFEGIGGHPGPLWCRCGASHASRGRMS